MDIILRELRKKGGGNVEDIIQELRKDIQMIADMILVIECTECTGDLQPKVPHPFEDYGKYYQCVECGTIFDRKLIEG